MHWGRAEAQLDDKGRIAMPARFRAHIVDEGDGHLVVTSHPAQDCLMLYTQKKWEEVQATLATLSTFKDARWTMLGNASDVKMDKQGRLLVPVVLREEVGLQERMVLTGQGDFLELWDASAYRIEAQRAKAATRQAAADGVGSGVPGLPF